MFLKFIQLSCLCEIQQVVKNNGLNKRFAEPGVKSRQAGLDSKFKSCVRSAIKLFSSRRLNYRSAGILSQHVRGGAICASL